MVRGSLRFVPWKERKHVARDLRAVFQAPTLEGGERALEIFAARWDEHFSLISRKWKANWSDLTPLCDYPPDLRKVMYTTNAVEAINAQLQKVTKKRGAFPTPESARKVLYLAIMKASERWRRSVKNWKDALYHLSIVLPDRVPL